MLQECIQDLGGDVGDRNPQWDPWKKPHWESGDSLPEADNLKKTVLQ